MQCVLCLKALRLSSGALQALGHPRHSGQHAGVGNGLPHFQQLGAVQQPGASGSRPLRQEPSKHGPSRPVLFATYLFTYQSISDVVKLGEVKHLQRLHFALP